jgi:hypothetical protein
VDCDRDAASASSASGVQFLGATIYSKSRTRTACGTSEYCLYNPLRHEWKQTDKADCECSGDDTVLKSLRLAALGKLRAYDADSCDQQCVETPECAEFYVWGKYCTLYKAGCPHTGSKTGQKCYTPSPHATPPAIPETCEHKPAHNADRDAVEYCPTIPTKSATGAPDGTACTLAQQCQLAPFKPSPKALTINFGGSSWGADTFSDKANDIKRAYCEFSTQAGAGTLPIAYQNTPTKSTATTGDALFTKIAADTCELTYCKLYTEGCSTEYPGGLGASYLEVDGKTINATTDVAAGWS